MRNSQNFWDKNAGRYDRFMRKDAAAYERLYRLLRPVVRQKTVLELATGTGLIAKHIVRSADHIEATDASQEMIEQAKQGKLALYWQRAIQREYHCKKVTPAEQQAYEQLQSILSEVPQWSDEEELRSGMEEIGGRVWFCHFWIDHNSMVQLTEDRNGGFHAAYVLDADASPEVRREAALLAQKELAKCMQEWGISLLNAPVPEQMKYASLAEAASPLMQVLNDPESITG